MALTLQLVSFSYKQSLPVDESENGGGFLFDCRCLPNPGRLTEYKTLSGQDQPVVTYLEQMASVNAFFEHTQALAQMAISNYMERNFDHLLVGYGCTGGQHRSVYFAERLAKKLHGQTNLIIELGHLNQARWVRK